MALAAAGGLGGVILFTRNCPTLDTVLTLTADARRLDPDLLVLVDHEGGRVHRLPEPFTRFPAAAVVGRAGDPALAAAVGRAMARELRAAGFDSGLTPVLDSLTDPGCTVIGDRAFGRDPEVVAACGIAFAGAAAGRGPDPGRQALPGARAEHRGLPRGLARDRRLEPRRSRPSSWSPSGGRSPRGARPS